MLRLLFPCCLLVTACGAGTATLANPDCIAHLAVAQPVLIAEVNRPVELSAKWANGCEGAVAGATIQFKLTDAPVGTWLVQTQAVTGADGLARVTLQTGAAPGVALISARSGGESVDLSVTVTSASAAGGGGGSATGGGTGGGMAAGGGGDATGGGTGGGASGGGTGGGTGGGLTGGGTGGGATGGGTGGGTTGGGTGGGTTGGGTGGGTTGGGTGGGATGGGGASGGGSGGGAATGGGGTVAGDSAVLVSNTLPASMACGATATASVTLRNNGSTTWNVATHQLAYVGELGHLFLPPGELPRIDLPSAVAPGATVTLPIELHAPILAGTWEARFRMSNGTTLFGAALPGSITVSCAPITSCSFPQGVPEANFTGHNDTNATVANLVNTVMEQLSGCGRSSDCYIGDRYTDQTWFAAVTAELRARGLCAGQHELGYTDEIAVSMTGCGGLWFGYHVFYYGGQKVVWNNGAQRGSWSITPSWCP